VLLIFLSIRKRAKHILKKLQKMAYVDKFFGVTRAIAGFAYGATVWHGLTVKDF